MRTLDIYFKLLRNGVDFAEIFADDDSTPSLHQSGDKELKISLSGVFLPYAVDASGRTIEPNWLKDEIKPIMVIDGVQHDLGIYLVGSSEPETNETCKLLRIEAYDRCLRLKTTNSDDLIHFSAGTNYLDAIEQLLTEAGITTVVKTPNASTISEDREDWDIGTSYLTIINQLLGEINYNQLWFSSNGAAVLEPKSVPTAQNIDHRFDAGDPDTLIIPGMSRKNDIFDAPNYFICICSNADKSGPLVATAENANPQSPLSTVSRGRRITKVVRVNNIASQEALQIYVNSLRDESMITGETIKVTTALRPGFGVGDVSAIHYDDVDAICIESDWDMELKTGGNMSHTLQRVVYNIG